MFCHLHDGSVFLPGGSGPPIFPDAEIDDWHAGTWTTVAPMHVARAAAVAVRLPDGRVMVVGGFDASFDGIDSAEIYDPRANSGSFTEPLHSRRAEDFVATLLPGGRVLIAGGYLRGFPFIPLSSSEIWDPGTNGWSVAAPELPHHNAGRPVDRPGGKETGVSTDRTLTPLVRRCGERVDAGNEKDGVAMLSDHPVFPILLSTDLDASRAFYHDILGLDVLREDPDDRIVFRCGGGTQLAVTKSTTGTSDTQTQIAWRVPDIRAALADLRARGVRIEEYEAPDPVTVDGIADMGHSWAAWFIDPSRNVLAVVQPKG